MRKREQLDFGTQDIVYIWKGQEEVNLEPRYYKKKKEKQTIEYTDDDIYKVKNIKWRKSHFTIERFFRIVMSSQWSIERIQKERGLEFMKTEKEIMARISYLEQQIKEEVDFEEKEILASEIFSLEDNLEEIRHENLQR